MGTPATHKTKGKGTPATHKKHPREEWSYRFCSWSLPSEVLFLVPAFRGSVPGPCLSRFCSWALPSEVLFLVPAFRGSVPGPCLPRFCSWSLPSEVLFLVPAFRGSVPGPCLPRFCSWSLPSEVLFLVPAFRGSVPGPCLPRFCSWSLPSEVLFLVPAFRGSVPGPCLPRFCSWSLPSEVLFLVAAFREPLEAEDILIHHNVTGMGTCNITLTCAVAQPQVTVSWDETNQIGTEVEGDTLHIYNVDTNVTYSCTAQNPISRASRTINPWDLCYKGAEPEGPRPATVAPFSENALEENQILKDQGVPPPDLGTI
ncbi:hypothetical protein XENTR_v10022574 [Xenopus tropicalis]|nr:hypothetical protein XENTR_v10022574 [Xenopus tropicalis]